MTNSNDALWEAARDEAGVLHEDVLNNANVERADDTYRTGATGMDVQVDQVAREAAAVEVFTEITNANLGNDLLNTVNDQGVPVYAGGNIVAETADTEMLGLVRTALVGGDLFVKGGQIPPTNYTDSADVSPYHDPLWLVEASKLTGEKFF